MFFTFYTSDSPLTHIRIITTPFIVPLFEVNRYGHNSNSGRKWPHAPRMNPPHRTTTPFTSGQRSAQPLGGGTLCVFEICVRAASDQLSEADSWSDLSVCVSDCVVCQACVTVLCKCACVFCFWIVGLAFSQVDVSLLLIVTLCPVRVEVWDFRRDFCATAFPFKSRMTFFELKTARWHRSLVLLSLGGKNKIHISVFSSSSVSWYQSHKLTKFVLVKRCQVCFCLFFLHYDHSKLCYYLLWGY